MLPSRFLGFLAPRLYHAHEPGRVIDGEEDAIWNKRADAEQPLRAWYHDVRKADWSSPSDVKRVYSNASIVGENRIVFNIGGNRYRLENPRDLAHGLVEFLSTA